MSEQPRMLDIKAVMARTGLSRASIYRLLKPEGDRHSNGENRFPAPFKLTKRAVRWRADEVDEWLNQRPRTTELSEAGC